MCPQVPRSKCPNVRVRLRLTVSRMARRPHTLSASNVHMRPTLQVRYMRTRSTVWVGSEEALEGFTQLQSGEEARRRSRITESGYLESEGDGSPDRWKH